MLSEILLMFGVISVPLIFFVFPILIMGGLALALVAMHYRSKRFGQETEVRKLEAQARLLEAQARIALPDFVDAADPESVAAYSRARKEVNMQAERGL